MFHPRLRQQQYSGAHFRSFAYTHHAIMLARDLVPLGFAWFWHDHCPQFNVHHKALADHLMCSHLSPFRPISSRWPCTPPLFTWLVPLDGSTLKGASTCNYFLFSLDVLQPPYLSFRPFHPYQQSQPHLLNASTSLCPQHSPQSSHSSGLLSFLPLQIKFDSCLLKSQIYPSFCLPRYKVDWVQSISFLVDCLLITIDYLWCIWSLIHPQYVWHFGDETEKDNNLEVNCL